MLDPASEPLQCRTAKKSCGAILAAILLFLRNDFEPNFLVQIDKRDFTEGFLERLHAQGHDPRELLKAIPPEFGEELPLLPEDILRWVIVSLSLCRTFNEITLPALRFEFRHGDTPGQLIASGCCATHAGHDRSMYTMVSHYPELAGPLDLGILNKLATAIEPYYQPIQWRYDPVSVALSCFWAKAYALASGEINIW